MRTSDPEDVAVRERHAPTTPRAGARPDSRAELQRWYLGSLRPKLARAARAGTVAPAVADELDRQLRDFLDLPEDDEGLQRGRLSDECG